MPFDGRTAENMAREAHKAVHCLGFIRDWIKHVADAFPKENVIRLPFHTRKCFYDLYWHHAELAAETDHAAGFKLFYQILQVQSAL